MRIFPVYIHFTSLVFLFFGISLSHNIANAQAPTQNEINRSLEEQQRVLRRQETRRREQLRELRKTLAPPKEEGAKDDSLQDQSKNCVNVNVIEFDGADLLNDDVKNTIQKTFAGKCMSIIDIIAVVRVVTNWYISKGFITTRAFPPEQDISDGSLKIKVVEGRTENLDIKENGKPRKGFDNAFPRLVGKRLFIRDIEQGLDQINRLPSQDAKIRIEPGKKDGFSKVKIDTYKRLYPYVITTIDNYGVKSTGPNQVTATAFVDDVFGVYDAWTFSHKTSDPFYDDGKRNREYSGSLSLPLGYWTLLLSGSYFDYQSTVEGDSGEIVSTGNTQFYTAELDRVIHRDQLSKTRMSAYLSYKDTENFINDTKIGLQSRSLSSVGGRISHNRRIIGGLVDLSFDANFGVPLFSSLRNEEAPGPEVPEYTKLTGDISFYRPFQIGKLNLAYSMRGFAQWSPDNLFSSEQLSLGGIYSVRGYRDERITGDTGGYIRNELILTMPQLLSEKAHKILGRLDLFAAYDAGFLHRDEDNFQERGTLTGFATGIRLNGGVLFGEASWEKSLEAPDFVKDIDSFRDRNGEVVRFKAGLSFKW